MESGRLFAVGRSSSMSSSSLKYARREAPWFTHREERKISNTDTRGQL